MVSSSSSATSDEINNRQPRLVNYPMILRRPRFCEHGPASLQTSHTPQDPERRFYCCKFIGSAVECKMREWRDPELSSHYKSEFVKLKLEAERAQQQRLNECKAREKTTQELQSKIDDLLNNIDHLEAIVDGQNSKIRVLLFAFGFGALVLAYVFSK